jgi:chaperonin cofactor prefoldin
MMGDPTMEGIKDPARKIKKLQERIDHLESEQKRMDDQIEIMQCEISRLQSASAVY